MTHVSTPAWMQTRAQNIRRVAHAGVYVTIDTHVVVVDDTVLRFGTVPRAFGWKVDGIPVPRNRTHACRLVLEAGVRIPSEVRRLDQITVPGVWLAPSGDLLRLRDHAFGTDGKPVFEIGSNRGHTFVLLDMDPECSDAKARSRAKALHRMTHF